MYPLTVQIPSKNIPTKEGFSEKTVESAFLRRSLGVGTMQNYIASQLRDHCPA